MKKNEVYNCFEYAFRCPRTWESFAPTDDPKIRFCDECRQNVHLCETPEELRANVERLFCVAFPPAGFSGETATDPVVEVPAPPLPPGMMMPLPYPPDGFATVFLEPLRELKKDEIDYLAFAFRADPGVLRDSHRTGEPVILSDRVPKETADRIGDRLRSRNIPFRIEAHPE
ncbi:MAG: hypothetical protein JSS81_21775 [Acidobacteria bacterium]|nr:hypothetical protein [Acidobacteriota bacterium]